jgi:hypothetical protein
VFLNSGSRSRTAYERGATAHQSRLTPRNSAATIRHWDRGATAVEAQKLIARNTLYYKMPKRGIRA